VERRPRFVFIGALGGEMEVQPSETAVQIVILLLLQHPPLGDVAGYLLHDAPVRLLHGVELGGGLSISTATALLTPYAHLPLKTLMCRHPALKGGAFRFVMMGKCTEYKCRFLNCSA